MRVREGDPPAPVADPLDHADQIALAVAAVAQRPGLVAEHQGAEEDHPPAIVREDDADWALRSAELGEMEASADHPEPAAEGRVGDIIEQVDPRRAELERAAIIVARRRRGIGERRVGREQHALARDLAFIVAGADLAERVAPSVSPVAQAPAVVLGRGAAPARLATGRDDVVVGLGGGGLGEGEQGQGKQGCESGPHRFRPCARAQAPATLRPEPAAQAWGFPCGRACPAIDVGIAFGGNSMIRPLTALAAVLLSVATPWAAAGQAPAPAGPPSGDAAQGADAVEAARAAVGAADFERVGSDRAYASEVLGHLDLLAGDADTYARLARNIETLRLFPLLSLERADQVRDTLDRLLAMRPDQADHYPTLFLAALSINDYRRLAAAVETASLNVRGTGWSELRRLLERETVWPVLHRLRREDRPAHVRFTGALFRIGWTGGDTSGSASDSLRMILLDDALRRGDRDAARSFASGIATPATMAPLLILRRYDGLLPERDDRLAPLRAALAEQERITAEDVARDPQNLKYLLERVQHLRALGRNADALALARPLLGDPTASALRSEDGMWLVNEAAYALLDLGRGEEAAGLMTGLTRLPVAEHGYLISSIINQGEVLSQAARHADSLAHGQRIERDFAQFSSDYGDMWMRATVVCALANLDRVAEAAPTITAMRAAQDINPAAMMRAYLCLNDLDAAERLIISRLEGEEPEEAVMALQDYALEPRRDVLVERLLAVRARPAVNAALERVARVVVLPLARTYWGGF